MGGAVGVESLGGVDAVRERYGPGFVGFVDEEDLVLVVVGGGVRIGVVLLLLRRLLCLRWWVEWDLLL